LFKIIKFVHKLEVINFVIIKIMQMNNKLILKNSRTILPNEIF